MFISASTLLAQTSNTSTISCPLPVAVPTGLSPASYSLAQIVQPGTGARPRNPNSKLGDIVSIKDFGAVGDGVTDDTAAIQAAIDATSRKPLQGGGVYCPAGTYIISSSLNITNVMGFTFEGVGEGCTFSWSGGSTGPLLNLTAVANSTFEKFKLTVTSPATPLAEGIRIQTGPFSSVVAPTQNVFRDVLIQGVNGYINIGVRGAVGAGGDNNDDFMTFDNVRIANYAIAGWTIEGTQMNGWRMTNCRTNAAVGIGKYSVSGGPSTSTASNFFWYGGLVSGDTGANFFVGAPSSSALGYIIEGVSSESSNRFLDTGGIAGAALHLKIDTVRFASNGLNADGVAVRLQTPGPFTIINSRFGEGDNMKAVKIAWSYLTGYSRPSLAFITSEVFGSLTRAAAIFSGAQPTIILGSAAVTGSSAYYSLDNGGYLVSTLPACDQTTYGLKATVSDAKGPAFLSALMGGGAVSTPVYCNGTEWVSY